MKKLILIGTMSILIVTTTGCASSESYFKKVPFLKNIVQQNQDGQSIEQSKHSNDSSLKHENQPVDELALDPIFFNQIIEINGQKIIQNPENKMALVNKQFGLPETFLPNDLIRPKVSFSFGDQKVEKSMLRSEAALALERMFTDAKQNGIELFAVSGYRSYKYQNTLFQAEVKRVGKEKAMEAVAFPGQSEHQTGLAMDISCRSQGMLLTEAFGVTKEGKWLNDNAHRFGFILRYPKGKEPITGYQYEAWHFRYVGIKAATTIYNHHWTLEEYFNMVKKV